MSKLRKKTIGILLIILILAFTFNPAFTNEQENKKSDKILLNAEDIESMKVSSIQDLIDKIPGISVDSSTVYIRGSKDVLVIVDGRQINDPVTRAVKWEQVSFNNIEKIEIIKGGGSTEYGENSSGGVILISTKMGGKFSGSLEAYGGNYRTRSISADVNTSRDNLNIGTSVGYSSSGFFFPNNGTESLRASINLSYEAQKDVTFSPSFIYYNEDRGLSGTINNPTPYNRRNYDSYSFILSSQIKGINSKSYLNDVVNHNTDPAAAGGLQDVKIHPRTFSQEFTSGFSLKSWGEMNCGAGYEYVSIGVDKNVNSVVSPHENHTDKKGWIFATHKIAPSNSSFSFYSGLRGIYYSLYDNAVNPEFKLEYNKGTYGLTMGFNMADNSPSVNARYNQDSLMQPNPDLDKESYTNYSATVFILPSESVYFTATPYYSIVNDMFVLGPVPAGMRYENVGQAILKGMDASIDWKPLKQLKMSLAYSYLDAKNDQTGNYLPGKSKHKIQLRAIMKPFRLFSLSLTGSTFSRQYSNPTNSVYIDKYFLVDVRAEYNPGKFNIYAQVKNLFNREYTSYYGTPKAKREWIAGLKYTF